MKRPLLFVLLLLFFVPAWGQGLMQRKRRDIIPLEGQARRIGFYFAPGVTYTLPRSNNDEQEMFRNGDTSFVATYDAEGRLGLYLEAGLSWYTRDPVIVDYLDVGLAYKNLRGGESSVGRYALGDSLAPLLAEGDFAERMLTLHINANKFIPTWRYQFVQLTLGANADYRLGSAYAHTGDPRFNAHAFPPDLWTQAHVKLGYGFKVSGTLLIIPAIETPIFSVAPADDGRFGALRWFSSEYRPLILSVRFLFLRARSGFDCPPPIKPNALEGGKRKQYKPDSYHP